MVSKPVNETGGVFLGQDDLTPEMVKEAWDDIGSFVKAAPQSQALDQSQKLIGLAISAIQEADG